MQERRRLVELIKNGEMMRTTVSVTHADTQQTRITTKKSEKIVHARCNTETWKDKKQRVQLGHLVLLPDRYGPIFMTRHSV